MALEIFRLVGSIFVDNEKANKSIHETDKNAEGAASKFAQGVKTVGKWGLAVVGAASAAATAIGGFSVKALKSYADYEQLVGGVDTLFKDSSAKVQQYAAEAYKTAGMSANEYMETVTSFSASLIQSMGGDTDAAAEKANMALTDMSDNANKMGTDMSLIQSAYNGFAKQNYTMLDNLKLGYGGTKTEMQRLIKHANELNAAQGKYTEYSIDSYADIVDAIHTVQDEMGITNTTANEAASTIQGALGMTKSSWENLMTAFAGGSFYDDIDVYIEDFIHSVTTLGEQVLPRLVETVPRIAEGFAQIIQNLTAYIPGFLEKLLPPIITGASKLLASLVQQLPAILSAFLSAVIPFIQTYVMDPISEYLGIGTLDLQTMFDEVVAFFEGMWASCQEIWTSVGQPIWDAIISVIGSVVTWIQNNKETFMTLVSIVGSFAAAWVLVNGAITIWNAIGVAATAVTTAFGAAVAFLTSPIGIVTVAIGALIAIVVLLAKNWDTVKEACSNAWEWIKGIFSQVCNWVNTNLIQPVVKAFQAFGTSIKNVFNGIWSGIKGVINWILGGIEGLVNGVISGINTLLGGIDTIVAGVGNLLGLSWSVPTLNPVSLPRLEKGGILEKGQTGYLEGNGAEAVVPLENNKKWISRVAADMADATEATGGKHVEAVLMDILEAVEQLLHLGIYLDTGRLVGGLAGPMDRELGRIQAMKARG